VLAWAEFTADQFEYVHGEPAIYRSSSSARREFCAACGTQILFRMDPPSEEVDVNVGSLDEPGRVEPTHHIWCASRIGWFEIADDLPRFEREST